MTVTRNFLILAFFTIALMTSEAFAEEDAMINEDIFSDDEFASFETMNEDELDESRGAFLEGTLNLADLEALVIGNSAINVNTGDNVVSDTAFNGTAGIVTSIQNSGNNVALQHTTIFNVNMNNSN